MSELKSGEKEHTAVVRARLNRLRELETDTLEVFEELREDAVANIDHAQCESCAAYILPGEPSFGYQSGERLCGECSPTWTEAAVEWDELIKAEPDDEDIREAAQRFGTMMTAFIAQGGDPSTKCGDPF